MVLRNVKHDMIQNEVFWYAVLVERVIIRDRWFTHVLDPKNYPPKYTRVRCYHPPKMGHTGSSPIARNVSVFDTLNGPRVTNDHPILPSRKNGP
jgi:hypothetical protein